MYIPQVQCVHIKLRGVCLYEISGVRKRRGFRQLRWTFHHRTGQKRIGLRPSVGEYVCRNAEISVKTIGIWHRCMA